MSYDIERQVLTDFIVTDNSEFGLSPFGLDGEAVKLSDNSGYMGIVQGVARQASTGSPGANFHDYTGILTITLVTPGKNGAAGATGFVDTIIAAFTGLRLDETGSQPTVSSAVVIDFGRTGLVPYVSSSRSEAPFYRTVINAPFLRTERK